MGLDGVELVMAFEEAFGIGIPDEDAARLETPRHVMEYVAARLSIAPSTGCKTQRSFYALRRGLRAAGITGVELRPGTPLRTLADRTSWPVLWTRARIRADRPEWPEQMPWEGFWRDGPRTLADLARRVSVVPPPHRREPWTREQIEFMVREVVRDTAGVGDFDLDHRFVRDMGID
jgi:hypothetical protein